MTNCVPVDDHVSGLEAGERDDGLSTGVEFVAVFTAVPSSTTEQPPLYCSTFASSMPTYYDTLSDSNLFADSDDDFDDCLDLNEEDCERELKTCDEKIQEIEHNFYFLKNLLLKDEIQEIDEKIVEIKSGTADEYRVLFEELKNKKESQLKVATVLKEFQLENLKHKFQAEDQAIKQNIKNNKEILYDTIKSNLEKELKQLTDARKKADIDNLLWLNRNLKQDGFDENPFREKQPKSKPISVTGPCIVHMLHEHEILEDWIAIKTIISSKKIKCVNQQLK